MQQVTYDDNQISAPLRACSKCGKKYYMKSLICALCGPGWRTEQRPPEPKTDVNGNAMIEP